MDPLDNVAWHALTGPLAHLAELRPAREPVAARFQPDVSIFAALPDDPDPASWEALAALLGRGGLAVLLPSAPLDPPPGWAVEVVGDGVQMVGDDAPVAPVDAAGDGDPAAAGDEVVELVELGPPDVPEMLDLVGRTRPGPFAARTVEVGRYVGFRDRGRLVAMAGERLRIDGRIEVSGVCTDEDHRGRGLARVLVNEVVAGIHAQGARPMLHAAADNEVAIRLYASMGFTVRRSLQIALVRFTGDGVR